MICFTFMIYGIKYHKNETRYVVLATLIVIKDCLLILNDFPILGDRRDLSFGCELDLILQDMTMMEILKVF